MLAWEFGALLDGGGQLDHVLGELAQSSSVEASRNSGKRALPGRLYEMGLLDLDRLARGVPLAYQAQILDLTFALFACSFVELAAPPQGRTNEAATLFRRLSPLFEASHGAMLAGLRSILGLSPQSLIAWSGGGRSMDPLSGPDASALAASASAVVLPSVTGSSSAMSSSSSTSAALGAEVRGVRTGSSLARAVAGPDFGQLPARPLPALLRWRNPARPCVVRMSPLARSLAVGTMQRRGYAWLLRHLAPGTGTVRIVFTPSGTDSGASGLGGSWAERLALPPADLAAIDSSTAAEAAAATQAVRTRGAAGAGDAGGDGDEGENGDESDAADLAAPLLPQRGEAFGEGAPQPPGAVPRGLAALAPLSLSFLQPAERPQAAVQAVRIAEASAAAKLAAGVLAAPADAAAAAQSSAAASAALVGADALSLAERAGSSAAAVGAGATQAVASGVAGLCRQSVTGMRSPLDAETQLMSSVAEAARRHRFVIAESAERLRLMVRQRTAEQVEQAVQQGKDKDAAELQARRQLGAAAQQHHQQLTGVDRAFWPNVRTSLSSLMTQTLGASVMPGGSISVARALLAHAGVGQRGPRPAGMLDADSPAPANPTAAAFTVLGAGQASALAVGTRRGCVAAGFLDGGVLVWSRARRRWAEENEAETHRAGVGAGEVQGADGAAEGVAAPGEPEEDDDDADAILAEEEDDDAKRDDDDDDDMDAVAAMIAIDPASSSSSSSSSSSASSSSAAAGAAESSAATASRTAKRGRSGDVSVDGFSGAAAAGQAVFDIDSASASDPSQAMPRSGHHRPAVLLGHSGPVTCLALSPAEDWLLSGSVDGSVRLWSVPAGQCVAVYRHACGPVWAVSWCPGIPSLFASAAADGAARVWSTAETRRPARLLSTHSSSAEAVAWHPGCGYLLVGSSSGATRLFDVESGQPVRLLIGHACPVTAAAISPCGKLAFTADTQGCVRGWDLEGGWCLGAQWGAGLGAAAGAAASAVGVARVSSLAVSPSSRVLAAAGVDSRIALFDLRAWRISAERLRALHSPQLRSAASSSRSAAFDAAAAPDSGTLHRVPVSVITAEPEVEEAALAEAASDAAARAAWTQTMGESAAAVPAVRFQVLYGKSTRFGATAFSRDGVLTVAGVFDPPAAE